MVDAAVQGDVDAEGQESHAANLSHTLLAMERRARRITPHDYDRQPSILGWLLRRYEPLAGDLGNARTAAPRRIGVEPSEARARPPGRGADTRDHASPAARRQTGTQGLWITNMREADTAIGDRFTARVG